MNQNKQKLLINFLQVKIDTLIEDMLDLSEENNIDDRS